MTKHKLRYVTLKLFPLLKFRFVITKAVISEKKYLNRYVIIFFITVNVRPMAKQNDTLMTV